VADAGVDGGFFNGLLSGSDTSADWSKQVMPTSSNQVIVEVAQEHTDEPPSQSFSRRAKSGGKWVVVSFGLGQVLRLAVNVALAALLYEEVFALMAIVLAVMFGLAMFSDVGLKANVIQHARGDDPDFLNTAWTLQVARGFVLFSMTLIVAWPLSRIYGANDPKAYELLYLIPIAGLSALVSGFESAKLMTAARHLKVKEVTKIEVISGVLGAAMMLLLASVMRSVYALAIASVLNSVVVTVLSYWMLDGPKSRLRWEKESVRSIFSFGKWVFVSTFFTFSAAQVDRLAFGAMFPLADVGVYSIAASLAVMAPTLLGRLQHIVLFPWYSRMLAEGMPLSAAFNRTRPTTLVASSFVCTLMVSGSGSFFELAYDSRYVLGGELLPILAIGGWFSCVDAMYGSAFLASGRPKWTAICSANKVASFILLLLPISLFDLGIVFAAMSVAGSEMLRWIVSHAMGRRLGLRGLQWELGMLLFFLVASGAGWWMMQEGGPVSDLNPFWRLALLGILTMLLYAPMIFRFVLPLVRQR
jgi:O-antigen/teichoic acid export membrane protein